MRDVSLFNFQDAADLKLFLQLVSDGLQLYPNVTYRGGHYLDNVEHELL